MLFTGSYRRALDDKHRLPLPKPLRESGATPGRFYLTPGLDGCLALYPEAAFEMLGQRLAAHSPAARDVRDYSRLFYSQAACVTPDRQWRFRVPPELAAWAELAGEVTLVGVRDHLEIWSTEKWQRYVSRCDSQHDQLAEAAFVGAAPAGGAYQPPIAAPGEEETATPPRPR